MEITTEQIAEGMIFYGVKSNGDFPEFSKFEATKSTSKQVKAKKAKKVNHGGNYEYTLRASDWRYFSDFSSAIEAWIATVLDLDIKIAEYRLENAQDRKKTILAAEDIE